MENLTLAQNEIEKSDFQKLTPELKNKYIAIKQYETTVTKCWFDVGNHTIGRKCKRRIIYRINPIITYTETIDFVFNSDTTKIFQIIEKIAGDIKLGNDQKTQLLKSIISKM